MIFRSFWFDVKSFCLGILLESVLATQLFRYREAVSGRCLCCSLLAVDLYWKHRWALGRSRSDPLSPCWVSLCLCKSIVLIAWQRNPQQMTTWRYAFTLMDCVWSPSRVSGHVLAALSDLILLQTVMQVPGFYFSEYPQVFGIPSILKVGEWQSHNASTTASTDWIAAFRRAKSSGSQYAEYPAGSLRTYPSIGVQLVICECFLDETWFPWNPADH